MLRLLASLEHARLIRRQDDGRYALGMEIARLHGLYAASLSLERIVPPVLRALVAATGESAAYHVRQPQGDTWVRLCQFRVDSPHVVRDHVRVGDLLPNDRGAGARVLVAYGPEALLPRTGKERKLFDTIRAQGYAALVGDRTAELAGISAPVFHADGTLAAAVTLTMPTHRYDVRYIEPVRAAARELSGAGLNDQASALKPEFLDGHFPALQMRRLDGRQLGRPRMRGHEPQRIDLVLHIGHAQRVGHGTVDARDQIGRHAGRPVQPEEGVGRHVDAGLLQRGHVGQRTAALLAGHGQDAHLCPRDGARWFRRPCRPSAAPARR